jgi:hypothetical protein
VNFLALPFAGLGRGITFIENYTSFACREQEENAAGAYRLNSCCEDHYGGVE